jgi:hypothetical protein
MYSGGKKIIADEVEALSHLGTKPLGSDLWSRSARMTRKILGGKLPPVPEHSLFQEHNVTGSTGQGGPSPSIYYQSGHTFSHVTTAHDKPDNIGRSKVRTKSDYSIGNTGPQGVSQEFHGGHVTHTSRNPFKPVQSPQKQRQLHSTALHFPDPKAKYRK